MTDYAKLGWLDKIVNVSWRSDWLAIGVTAGGSSSTDAGSLNITANGLALGDLWTHPNTDLLKSSPIYKHDVNIHHAVSILYTNVEEQFDIPGGGTEFDPTHNWVKTTTQSPNPLALPSSCGTWDNLPTIETRWIPGSPLIMGTDVTDAISNLHHEFGDTTAPLQAGSTLGPFDHSFDERSWQRHGVAYIPLAPLVAKVGKAITVAVTTTGDRGSEHIEAYTFKFDPRKLPLDPQDVVSDEFLAKSESNITDDSPPTTLTFQVNGLTLS